MLGALSSTNEGPCLRGEQEQEKELYEMAGATHDQNRIRPGWFGWEVCVSHILPKEGEIWGTLCFVRGLGILIGGSDDSFEGQ